MTEYEKLQQTIGKVSLILDEYLSAAGYSESFTLNQLAAAGIRHNNIPDPSHPGRYIFLYQRRGLRNRELTEHRVRNVLQVMVDLDLLYKHSQPNLNFIERVEKLEQAQQILAAMSKENYGLSDRFHKKHLSFQERKTQNQNGFWSWCRSTFFFQSRATHAFERSIKHIDEQIPRFRIG